MRENLAPLRTPELSPSATISTLAAQCRSPPEWNRTRMAAPPRGRVAAPRGGPRIRLRARHVAVESNFHPTRPPRSPRRASSPTSATSSSRSSMTTATTSSPACTAGGHSELEPGSLRRQPVPAALKASGNSPGNPPAASLPTDLQRDLSRGVQRNTCPLDQRARPGTATASTKRLRRLNRLFQYTRNSIARVATVILEG